MKSIELTPIEIKVIDASLNFGTNSDVFHYLELIIENYFFGVRQSDKDFPNQSKNILKILNSEIEPTNSVGGTYLKYSVPTTEKYRDFAKEYIWKWFNKTTLLFEEFIIENTEYQNWEEYELPLHEFIEIIFNDFMLNISFNTFLEEETLQDQFDEISKVSDFEKK